MDGTYVEVGQLATIDTAQDAFLPLDFGTGPFLNKGSNASSYRNYTN